MAKQVGNIKFVGRYGNLCFYMARGKYYVRTISSLTRKRVKTDKKFAHTMAEAGLLGNASRVASFVYGSLPKTFRESWMFKSLTGEASRLLRAGKSVEEAKMELWKIHVEVWVMKEAEAAAPVSQQHTTIQSAKSKGRRKRRMHTSAGLFIAALSTQQKPVQRIPPMHLMPGKLPAADTG